MQTVREIARDIVAREGGYVDDPDDPGGATKHGVTIHTMRRLGLDLDRDGDVDSEDVKRITAGQAEDIFLLHYFQRPGLGRLPEAIQAPVFDMQVNAGSAAVRILQELLNDMGATLEVDGACGPLTARAAHGAATKGATLLRDAYGIARRNWYYALADRRPSSRKYARRRDGGKGGWIARAEAFVSPRFHLTDAEHGARVAAWG